MTTTENPNSETAPLIPGVHIQSVDRIHVSADGLTSMVVFRIEENGGTEFAMTFPTAGLGMLASLIQDLRDAAQRASLNPGMMLIREPQHYAVGNNLMRRGVVFLTFDPGTDQERIMAIQDQDAMNLAHMMVQNVQSRTAPTDLAKLAKKPSVLLPGLGGGRLILPRK